MIRKKDLKRDLYWQGREIDRHFEILWGIQGDLVRVAEQVDSRPWFQPTHSTYPEVDGYWPQVRYGEHQIWEAPAPTRTPEEAVKVAEEKIVAVLKEQFPR